MMKWVKRLIAVVVILVVLALIIPVIALFTIDPNSYKPLITDQVQKATGRTLTLDGDLKLSIFPQLSLKLGPARLSNAQGFGDMPFAQVESVEVGIAIWPPGPVLAGHIQADKLTVNGLNVDLHTARDGRTNWSDLSSSKEGEGKAKKASGTAAEPKEIHDGSKSMALAIEGVSLKNVKLRLRDDRDGSDTTIAPLNLETSKIRPGEPFDLKADLTALLGAAGKPATSVKLELKSKVTADPATQKYALDGLTLDANAKSGDQPEVKAHLAANVAADLQAGSAQVGALKLDVNGLPLEGEIKAQDLNGTPQFAGSLRSSGFNPREVLKSFDPKGLETADPDVLKSASLNLAFKGNAKNVQVTPLSLVIDQTELKGDAGVNLASSPAAITVMLQGTSMDVDRYLPPKSKDAAKSGGGEKKAAQDKSGQKEAALFPVDTLRGLNLKANVRFNQLKLNDIQMTNAGVVVSAQNGLIQIIPLDVKLFQGGLNTQANLDVRGQTPDLRLKTTLDSVQLGPLLQQIAGKDYLTGLGKVNIDVSSRGAVTEDIMRNLNGTMNVALNDGLLRHSDLSKRINEVVKFFRENRGNLKEAGLQALAGKLTPQQQQEGAATQTADASSPAPKEGEVTDQQTKFSTLNGSFNIVNGVMRNDDLKLLSNYILANGAGNVDLGGSAADYVLRIALNDKGEPKGGRFVPISIKGPFDSLHYGVDFKAALREEATQQFEQRKDKLLEKAQEKLKIKIPGLFQ